MLDKLAILIILIYTAYILLKKLRKSANYSILTFVFLTFFGVTYLYFYGYLTEKYCFDRDTEYSEVSHIFLHFLACIGHHAVLLL